MADKILIAGKSGAGKSRSLKNLDEKTTFHINCIGKKLPFKGGASKYQYVSVENAKGNMIKTRNPDVIIASLKKISDEMKHIKIVIVDDFTYVLMLENMDRAKEKGYEKFTEMAQHYTDILTSTDKLRDDLTVVFISHVEEDVNGSIKIKTIGKMLDDKVCIEGLFTVVLLSVCYKGQDKKMKHVFVTQGNGTTPVKTPEGMFEEPEIPNDLQYVLDKMEEYNN